MPQIKMLFTADFFIDMLEQFDVFALILELMKL